MADERAGAPWVVDRYEIHQAIGSGGMATVHLGRLCGPVGFTRTVAIKRLREAYAQDPQFVTMFVDEARIAARVRHPNVLQTLDVLSTSGELLLVMEYVHGESLSRLLRATAEAGARVPLAVAAAIAVQLLEGLHAAHSATDDAGRPLGIVHRDVSPENVLVGLDGLARVLDFGIAKATDQLHTTHHGEIKGKVAYLAPEQAFGQADPRSDIFSAAVVIWELLTARGLFRTENRNLTMEALAGVVIEPPSVHTPEAACLDAIVLRALESDPAKRFASAREMALAIEAAVSPAGSATVGTWVERTAGTTLQARHQDLAKLDGGTAVTGIRPSAPPPAETAIAQATLPPPVQRRSLALPAAGVVILALLILVATQALRAQPPAPAVSAPSTAGALPARLEAPPPAEPAPVEAAAAPVIPPPARGGAEALGAKPRRRAVKEAKNCSVPYVLDAGGIKRYKPECL